MNTPPLIIQFLQRKHAAETWVYERPPILLVEALCLIAGILAAPTRLAALLLLVSSPLALWATELARADRSAAARKAEIADALRLPKVELTCSKDIEKAAKNKQLVTATAPVVALALSVAGAGGQGLTLAVAVGFVVSVIRWAMVEAYGPWRAWYRGHVPVSPVSVAKAVIVAGIASNASRAEVGAELNAQLYALRFGRTPATVPHVWHDATSKPAAELAATSPYQSAELARMAEDIIASQRDKDGGAS